MGTEFLVACLWVVVLVYWFWSRWPGAADTMRRLSTRSCECSKMPPPREWHLPTDSRAATILFPGHGPLIAAVALCHKRAQLRRRRRDTLSALCGVVWWPCSGRCYAVGHRLGGPGRVRPRPGLLRLAPGQGSPHGLRHRSWPSDGPGSHPRAWSGVGQSQTGVPAMDGPVVLSLGEARPYRGGGRLRQISPLTFLRTPSGRLFTCL